MASLIGLILGVALVGWILYIIVKAFITTLDSAANAAEYVGSKAFVRLVRLLGKGKGDIRVEISPSIITTKTSLYDDLVETYKQYKPNFSPISSPPKATWEQPSILMIERNRVNYENSWVTSTITVPQGKIKVDISGVNAFLRYTDMPIINQIENEIQSVKEYPVQKPEKVKIKKPPKLVLPEKLDLPEPIIELPLYDGFLKFLNRYVYLYYRDDIARVDEAINKRKILLDKEAKQLKELNFYYEKAEANYLESTATYEQLFNDAFRLWESHNDEWINSAQRDIQKLQQLKSTLMGQNVAESARVVLNLIKLPSWIPTEYEIKYDAESNILIVEHQVPDIGDIVWKKNVGLKSGLSEKLPNQKEVKYASEIIYPSIALKIAVELSNQINCPPDTALVFNGWADYTVKATGNKKRAYCVSFMAKVSTLRELNLSTLDPIAAFNNLKGISARSLELTPISPQIKINLDDRRFVEEKDILGKMSDDQNLASMNWEDFEHLCRELFEREFASSGSIVKVTQASRDQGVDAVIIDPHPVRGGKIVIQAKRYVNTVDVSAVRDLYGTLMNEGAMKGILVSTSNYGQDAYAFIQGKPLTLINGNELLSLLEQHGYKYRINLEEARQILKSNPYQSNNRYGGITNFSDDESE